MPPIGLFILNQYGFRGVTGFCVFLILIGFAIIQLLDAPSRLTNNKAQDLNQRLSVNGFKNSLKLASWVPPLTLLIMVIAFFGCLTFIPLISEERSIPEYYSFFTVYGFTVFISRLFVGRFSDKYGRELIIIPCIILCSIAMVVLAFSYSLAALWLTAVMFGIGWGSAFPTLLALASDYSAENTEGQTMSIMSASFSIGTALGGGMVGTISQYFTFELSFLLLAVLLLLTLVLFLIDFRSQNLIKAER
jgi:predicted MFS family arabinose efflux permease